MAERSPPQLKPVPEGDGSFRDAGAGRYGYAPTREACRHERDTIVELWIAELE
jgi:hypothetical protein